MKLGFITLNTYATDSCEQAIPLVADEVEEEPEPVVEQEESVSSLIIDTINGDVTLRFLTLTVLALIIVGMLLCICTQCVKCCCPNKASV